MLEVLRQAHRVANWISKPAALLGVLALLGVAGLTIANILGRWLLNAPIIGTHDLFGLVIIIVVAACFPTGVMQRKHVAIQFLGAGLGPKAGRAFDTFAAFLTAAFLAIIAWQLTIDAIDRMQSGEYTLVLKIATAPVWLVAAIAVWVSVPMQLVVTAMLATGLEQGEQGEYRRGE